MILEARIVVIFKGHGLGGGKEGGNAPRLHLVVFAQVYKCGKNPVSYTLTCALDSVQPIPH